MHPHLARPQRQRHAGFPRNRLLTAHLRFAQARTCQLCFCGRCAACCLSLRPASQGSNRLRPQRIETISDPAPDPDPGPDPTLTRTLNLHPDPNPSFNLAPDPAQVVQHGGRADAAIREETTQLVVLPQPAGAHVTAAALLEWANRGGGLGAPALANLRSCLANGTLQMLTPT